MFDFSSRSGKCQGILRIGQGIFKYQESQEKVREFHNWAKNIWVVAGILSILSV